MLSYFDSLFTTKDIVRKKYPGGWVGWINDGMSDDDDGQLTRFTTMCGYHMHNTIEKLIKYGFKEPEISNDNINFNDFWYLFRRFFKSPLSQLLKAITHSTLIIIFTILICVTHMSHTY